MFNTGPHMRKLYTCIYGNKNIAILFYIVLQPSGITNTASNCYASSVLQCPMTHPVFFRILAINQQTYMLWMFKVTYNICIVNLKLKIQISINLCCHTGLCLLKILLNLYRMYRYSSDMTTLVQILLSKREKYNKYIRAYYWKQILMNHLFLVDTQDAHEYYIQLINNLTELFDAR